MDEKPNTDKDNSYYIHTCRKVPLNNRRMPYDGLFPAQASASSVSNLEVKMSLLSMALPMLLLGVVNGETQRYEKISDNLS